MVEMKKNEMIDTKHSSLETSSDIQDTLEWKLENLKAENLPTDTGLADYIAFSIDSLDSQLQQLKAAKGEIKQREDAIKNQIEAIKVEGATFLLENGAQKLDGAICSSISVTKAKDETVTTTKTKKVKRLIGDAAINDLLLGMGMAEMEEVEEEKKTKAQPAKIRVNKRRIVVPEVE